MSTRVLFAVCVVMKRIQHGVQVGLMMDNDSYLGFCILLCYVLSVDLTDATNQPLFLLRNH